MADTKTIKLRFDDSTYQTAEVTRLGASLFRLEQTPLAAVEPMYRGDIIETEPLADGTDRYVRIVERAPMRHYSWIVARSWAESADRAAYIAKLTAAGGSVEQYMGGVFHVHVPV